MVATTIQSVLFGGIASPFYYTLVWMCQLLSISTYLCTMQEACAEQMSPMII